MLRKRRHHFVITYIISPELQSRTFVGPMPRNSFAGLLSFGIAAWCGVGIDAFGLGASSRAFLSNPKLAAHPNIPKLILIAGCPGTGKSTFGMSIALDQGILKCVSTDTIRATMRSFVSAEVSPALHRSSYAAAFEGDDPVRSWLETCNVLSTSIEELVDDAMARGTSIVLEGDKIIPSNELIHKWEEAGGVAIGILLQIQDPVKHKRLLKRRGFVTGNRTNEAKKIRSYDRVRVLQEEMMRIAEESNWLRVEQRTDPDPLDVIAATLYGISIPGMDADKKKAEGDQDGGGGGSDASATEGKATDLEVEASGAEKVTGTKEEKNGIETSS